MSRKTKHAPNKTESLASVKARLTRALHEGRTMQALDLAEQVHKAEPSASHHEMLIDAYLARARQLRAQDKQRDAATVLQVAAGLHIADAARLAQVAEELAACGEVAQALKLVGESPARAQVQALATDAALRQQASGRKLLPEEMYPDFERVLQAFAQLEAGYDDAARETLQGIGLRSPFLEWKLFLRGLQAYYQGDDARAIENWQRLNQDRLPTRLASPMRFLIDSGYRTAQPPEAQRVLQRQADRFQDQGLLPHLRSIQTALAGTQGLTEAFRLASHLVPLIREHAPQLLPRLARHYYWSIVNVGQPEDVARYLRHFGPPPDDPTCDRLTALACEHVHDMQQAHEHWQKHEQVVAAGSTAWPSDQTTRVRALIWLHMGRNAAAVPDLDRLPELPPFLRDHPDRPRPLKPSAEKCLQNSLKLAPDLLEAHKALFDHLRDREENDKAERVAQQLLERFPEHVATLEALADLLMQKERYVEALELFQRALKGQPLDRRLRAKLGTAHTYNARAHAEAGRFDEARSEYQAALALEDNGSDSSVQCKWAACEFKAGNLERAEELLGQALQERDSRLSIAYSMLIETIRLKLPRPLKNRFDKEFKEALAEPPTGAGAAAVTATAAAHQAAGVTYYGQKTHEKKVLSYLEKAKRADFTEEQLAKVCSGLLILKATRLQRTYCQLGQRRFPKAAAFPYLEAESYFAKGPEMLYERWKVEPLLEKAHRLASEMPPDDRRKHLLEEIQERQKILGMIGGPHGFMNDLFEMDEFDDDDDDEDWDDFDDGW